MSEEMNVNDLNLEEQKPAATESQGTKAWYVVTTYAGNENKVAENIKLRRESMNLEDYIFRVLVAEESRPFISKDGTHKMVKNKETGLMEPKMKIVNLYPGYVFVEMIMTDESWFMIRNTPRVTGIAGSSGGGQKPTPVPSAQVEAVLKRMGVVDSSMYDRYHIGDTIKIMSGVFKDLEGKISRIDKEKGQVTIDTVFFGRNTTVDVDFTEIMRI